MNSYRLWDKINSMYVDTKDVVMNLDGSHIWWDIGDSGEMEYEDNREDYKLEQSSGYTDKWGNQVFEGDIVKVFYSGNEDYTGLAKVYFKYGSFQLSGKLWMIFSQIICYLVIQKSIIEIYGGIK